MRKPVAYLCEHKKGDTHVGFSREAQRIEGNLRALRFPDSATCPGATPLYTTRGVAALRAVKGWWNYVPPGYFTNNGFWVIALLILLSPLLGAGLFGLVYTLATRS